MALTPKQAGSRAGLPRPVADHNVSQNLHQLQAEIDQLGRVQESSALPRFVWFDSVLNPDGTADITVRVDDPNNLPGELRAWVNRAGYTSPDPTDLPDGTVELAVTPATVLPATLFTPVGGGATVALFDGVTVPAASGKRVFLEFINEDGLSTGVQDFVLVGSGGVVTPGGALDDGAITSRDQFVAGVEPILIVDTLPVSCTLGQVVVYSPDGKLYRCTGSGWVQVVRAPDLDGVLTAEQLEDEIISTAKFAAGIRPVRILGTLPAAGDVEGDVVYLTTDNLLYRWDGAAWTTAVKTADLSGLVQGAQIVDAAIDAVKLADLAVTNAKVANTTLTGAKVVAGTITSSLIQSRTVAADRIASNVLTTGEIQAGGIHGDRVQATTVDAGRMVANTLTAGQIATGAIATDELAAGAVTATRLAALSVYATNIVAGEINANHIAANSIDVGHIVAGGITASWIAANAITAAKIQAGAIGVDHINTRRLSNAANTVGILFDYGQAGEGNPGWTNYMSLNSALGWFLYADSGAFRVGHNGEVYGTKMFISGDSTFGGKMTVDTTSLAGNYISFQQSSVEKAYIRSYAGLPGIDIGVSGSSNISIWDNGGTTRMLLTANQLGFFATSPVNKQTVTGSKGGNAALASLMTALSNMGLVTDNTT